MYCIVIVVANSVADMVDGAIVPFPSIDDVRATIKELKKKFAALKNKIRQCIEDRSP